MQKVIIGVGVVILVLVGVAAVFLMNINSAVKHGIEVAGPEILGTGVTVDSVDISFLSGSGSIKGLTVMNPEGYKDAAAISIGEVKVSLNPRTVTSDKIHIYEVLIDSPVIAYEGNLRDSNLQTLQRNAAAGGGTSETSETQAEPGPSVMIDSLKLSNVELGVHISFLDDPLALVLPSLEMQDIGKDKDTSAADVLGQVLSALNKSIIPLIRENSGDFSGQLKEKTEQLEGKVKEGIDKLKGLFKKGGG